MKILTLNPGGNSLKAELVECLSGQTFAFEAQSIWSIGIEGIGHAAKLSIMDGKRSGHTESISAKDYREAASSFLSWWETNVEVRSLARLEEVNAIAVRVVHGGTQFSEPALIDEKVIDAIRAFEALAPLHNKSSIEILEPIRKKFSKKPVFAVFDTSFHRTIPEYASLYAIPLDLAERHGIRRYGFHGISHRYLLERFAHLAGRDVEDCNVVSMHLESGCSVTAIRKGMSVDNTMGFTPIEGLMMGTRSGDIDPSVVPYLMRAENMQAEEVLTLLNKESGLKGVSEVSLDTRVLMQQYDSSPKVKLALDMFSYRVRKAVGAYFAVLGSVDAIVFGGGIAENNSLLRATVCEGLSGFGLAMDIEANVRLVDDEGLLSTEGTSPQAWVIPTQEGLQLAHECMNAVGTH